jgi:predicted  nucleic acid-binding Zn-ribbon protein
MPLPFQKIKYSPKKGVRLEWVEKQDQGHEREVKLRSEDDPSPEFAAALHAFGRWVRELLGLDRDEWRADLQVLGVSFTEEESGTRGLVVTAARKITLAESVVTTAILNTPYVPEERNEDAIWPSYLRDAVKELETRAAGYRDGKERAQGELFDAKAAAAGEPSRASLEAELATLRARSDSAIAAAEKVLADGSVTINGREVTTPKDLVAGVEGILPFHKKKKSTGRDAAAGEERD